MCWSLTSEPAWRTTSSVSGSLRALTKGKREAVKRGSQIATAISSKARSDNHMTWYLQDGVFDRRFSTVGQTSSIRQERGFAGRGFGQYLLAR